MILVFQWNRMFVITQRVVIETESHTYYNL